MNLAGNLETKSAYIASGTTSLKVDLEGKVPCAIVIPPNLASTSFTLLANQGGVKGAIVKSAINNAGSGYSINDVITIVQNGASGGTITVNTIGAGGSVATYTLTTAGSDYFQATGLATTVAPSGGTSFTINILSVDGESYMPLVDRTNTALSFTVGATSKVMQLDPSSFAGITSLKFVTGSSETVKTFFIVTRSLG